MYIYLYLLLLHFCKECETKKKKVWDGIGLNFQNETTICQPHTLTINNKALSLLHSAFSHQKKEACRQ